MSDFALPEEHSNLSTMRERLQAMSLSTLLYYALTGTKPAAPTRVWTLESQS